MRPSNLLPALSACTVAFDHELVGAKLREFCEERAIHHISGNSLLILAQEISARTVYSDMVEHPLQLRVLVYRK